MPDQNWQFELEEYIKQGEPDRAEKSEAWQTAIGLQAVDGLNTSAYLLDTAKDHIEDGDQMELSLTDGIASVNGQEFVCTKLPPYMQNILDQGGLIASLNKEED